MQKLLEGILSIALLLALAACDNPLQRSSAGTEGLAPGMGRAVVSIASGNAKTALPGTVELAEYRVSFTRTGAEVPAWSGLSAAVSLSVDLEPGPYAVSVTGYDGSGEEAATGSGEISVSAGTLSSVVIQLGLGTDGTGALRYTLAIGEGTAFQYAILSAYTLPQGSLQRDIRFENEGGLIGLAAGYYRVSLSAFIVKDGVMQTHTKTTAVHIYPNQETALTLALDPYSGALGTEYSAGTAAELDAALASIKNSGDKNALITITANFSHAPIPLTDGGYNGKSISIRSADTASVKTISLSGNGSLFTLGTSSVAPTLVLSEVKLTGHGSNDTALVKIDGGRALVAGGAELSGNSSVHTNGSSYNGGGIAVESGALLRIYGGAVKNNTVSAFGTGSGGGVVVRGTFELYDGSIDHNTVNDGASYGGGVFVESSGTFKMYGGLIQYNSVTPQSISYGRRGGGVLVNGTFEMYGGSVDHNTANGGTINSEGGGIYVGDTGSFTMKDGDLAYNSCGGYGGGVYTAGTFAFEGGSIHDNTVSGDHGYGGGICCGKGTVVLGWDPDVSGESGFPAGTQPSVYNNSAWHGGGLSVGWEGVSGSQTGILKGAMIYGNTARRGGAA